MSGTKVGLYVTRGAQFVFAIIVLGLGADIASYINDNIGLIKELCHQAQDAGIDVDCNFDRVTSSLDYSAFTGAFGVLDAIVGLVAAFVTGLPWFVALALDSLAAVFFLASGINLAVLRGDPSDSCDGLGFCKKYDATTAFSFLAFVACCAAIVLGILNRRN